MFEADGTPRTTDVDAESEGERDESMDIQGVVDANERLWLAMFTGNGDSPVVDAGCLGHAEFCVANATMPDGEIAVIVEVQAKVGRTDQQLRFRISSEAEPRISEFLNDRMRTDVPSTKWNSEGLFELLRASGEILDLSVHGKVLSPSGK